MVEPKLVPEYAAGPVEENDQGHNLDSPKLNVVNDPVRIKTLSTHTISWPAVRDWRFQNCFGLLQLWPQPVGLTTGTENLESRFEVWFFEVVLSFVFVCSF